MKIINSSVTIIPQEEGLLGVYKQIEIGGRTAYKSENKITEDSAKAFVDMLIERGHTAPLEQGTIYLKRQFEPENNRAYLEFSHKYFTNPYSQAAVRVEDECNVLYITTNARVIYENGWKDDLQYLCEPTEFHEKRITARFICSRGISHELVRHRAFSFVQESTRYCNYSKDKFENQITFIKPYWSNIPTGEYTDFGYDPEEGLNFVSVDGTKYMIDEDNPITDMDYVLLAPLYLSEMYYMMGIDDKNLAPQQIREILPNALKTEVVMTGFVSDWAYFFNLRTANSAHPDMRNLATDLFNQFKEKNYIIEDA